MSLPSPAPRSREELGALFPDGVPVLLVKILFPTVSEELTVGDLRQIARALAAYDKSQQTPPPQTHVEPVEIPGELEMFNGKLTKVVDASRTGWWRFHTHRDRDGYCDNPARGY